MVGIDIKQKSNDMQISAIMTVSLLMMFVYT